MPDISMCDNDKCPSAKKCYRHEAQPSMRQSYSYFMPKDDADRCESFMKIWDGLEAAAMRRKLWKREKSDGKV